MKRVRTLGRWSSLVLAALLALTIPLLTFHSPPADAAVSLSNYFVQAVDESGDAIASGVVVYVFDTNTSTLSTIYTDSTFATTTPNPITGDGNGVAKWSGANATYDVNVVTQRGWSRYPALASNFRHRIVTSQQASLKKLKIPITVGGTAFTEINSGVLLPAGARVEDVWVEHFVNAAGGAGGTPAGNIFIDVGTLSSESGGVTNGFCRGVPIGGPFMGTGAFQRCQINVWPGNIPSAMTISGFWRGSLLMLGTNYNLPPIGSNGFSLGFGETVYLSPVQHTISYSHTGYTGTGYIHILYTEHRNR